MNIKEINYDCSRGCTTERAPSGELICTYNSHCCKRETHTWLDGVKMDDFKNYFEVRFKNTRKGFYENTSGQLLNIGDLVVTEATNGHDVGIITLNGAMCARQMLKLGLDYTKYEFKKIYRKAKPLDVERWQEAIALEHHTMIRARQISHEMGLDMKIGDVEFQGDGTKAIFYYIADERVDFRQLIKVFAEEFRIRIEMKQIGARQEAGLIGGIGVCGRALCCSNYISNFQSITTQSARVQDLSLNPQKLAGQCGKLKCCINYEAPVYIDAQSKMPHVNAPLELEDGQAYLIKRDILKGLFYFSYDPHSMSNMIALDSKTTLDIIKMNNKGIKARSLLDANNPKSERQQEFISSAGEDNIDRFDKKSKKKNNKKKRKDKEKEKENSGNEERKGAPKK